MKYIISKKYRNKYYNKITEYMDYYLKAFTDRYKVYIYDDKFKNRWTVRVPGCTIGYIEVDENDIISSIKIYTRNLHYFHPSVTHELHKFYDMKLIMEDDLNKYIISKKDNMGMYFNEITEYMDKYLRCNNIDFYKTYIYETKFDNRWIIRIPGCSVGYIEVDENDFIKDIKLNEDTMEWYNDKVLDELHKFHNIRLIIED